MERKPKAGRIGAGWRAVLAAIAFTAPATPPARAAEPVDLLAQAGASDTAALQAADDALVVAELRESQSRSELGGALLVAIEDEDLDAVRQALGDGASPDFHGTWFNRTFKGLYRENQDRIGFAFPQGKGSYFATQDVLCLAVATGNLEITRALLEKTARVNRHCRARDNFNHWDQVVDLTPLSIAVQSRDLKMTALLLEFRADPGMKVRIGRRWANGGMSVIDAMRDSREQYPNQQDADDQAMWKLLTAAREREKRHE